MLFLSGLRSGLFWRTFFLLAFLIATSMGAWVASFHVVERTPRGEQVAAQVVSIVTITRAALLHSNPALRRELLFDLASTQGIRVYPREDDDDVEPMPESDLTQVIEDNVQARLGQDTHFAGYVNDIRGFWVSFRIDDDDYWLMLDRDRVEQASGVQWLGWATVTLLLSLIGAAFISRLINQPLSRISSAARAVARGETPAELPEQGPAEIREANQSLLEVEMAGLSEDALKGMQSDLGQMEAIIAQFLDYARPADPANFTMHDLAASLRKITAEYQRRSDTTITMNIPERLSLRCNPTEIDRLVRNLIENARRYGKTPGTSITEIHISANVEKSMIRLDIVDHGNGLPEDQLGQVLLPFTRLDVARSQANGAGLGLAIVDRVVQRHQGKLELKNREGGGLAVRVWLNY
ncbi:MAG: ATP-binding protein [Oxalobacteraceae bacterium]|nr:ATP-binding protein [Oxalobacteraceae bacterium]